MDCGMVCSARHHDEPPKHTPEPARRHRPERKEAPKPKAPKPEPAKGLRHNVKKQPAKGLRKSAPRGAAEHGTVGILDLSHTPTLGSLPN